MDSETIKNKAISSYNNMNCKLIQLCQKHPGTIDKFRSLDLIKLHRSAMEVEEYELASYIHTEIRKRNDHSGIIQIE